jgi:hypothetical protein
MTCDEARTLLTIQTFGALDAVDLAALAAHIDGCPACAQAASQTADVRSALEPPADIPVPDWERAWHAIAAETIERPRPLWQRPALRAWVAAAAAIVIFVLGFTAGRVVPTNGQAGSVGRNGEAGGGVVTTLDASSPLQAYAQQAEQVLVSIGDAGPGRESSESLEARRRLLRSMIEDTRALQALALRAGDTELYAFFSEMEPLLVSLANLQPGDRGSVEWLNRMVREHQLRTRVRELARTDTRS